jgi:muramidase (phage lysozyme)
MSRYSDALANPNVHGFLYMIRAGEGTSDEGGYRRMFGGGMFESVADHPRTPVTRPMGTTTITSTAAGAYQFLSKTWDECVRALALPDFSPASQDIAAVYLIERRKALDDVIAGRVETAIQKCNREWASLPGSPYGQPTRTTAQALAVYAQHGGTTAPTQEAKMPFPAIIGALLPTLIGAIPDLAKIFKPGSEIAERNVAAATKVFEIAKSALDATNEQQVVERIQADPAAAATVRKAVADNWYQLTESGGGGIDGARKADLAFVAGTPGHWWDVLRSPSFLMACLLLPLVYLIVLSIIGVVGPVQWSDDVRAAIAGTIVGSIVGGLIGYYFGQTTTKNRTPAEATL